MITSVTLETTPERFVSIDASSFPEDYRRIVGIGTNEGEVTVSYRAPRKRQRETIRATDTLSKRLGGIFTQWFQDYDAARPNLKLPFEATDYQCHRVAAALGGISTVSALDAARTVRAMSENGVLVQDLDSPLPFGTHTVIRRADTHDVLHSSIAIGIDPEGQPNTSNTNDHLQAFEKRGYLGIAPLRTMVDFAGAETGRQIEVVAVPAHIISQVAASRQ